MRALFVPFALPSNSGERPPISDTIKPWQYLNSLPVAIKSDICTTESSCAGLGDGNKSEGLCVCVRERGGKMKYTIRHRNGIRRVFSPFTSTNIIGLRSS